MDKDKMKQDLEETEPINIELDHRTLKDELRKLKGKALVDNNVSNHPSDPELHQVNVEPITPKLLNKRTAHSAYIKHSQEEAAVLRDLVDHIKANYPLDPLLESAYLRNNILRSHSSDCDIKALIAVSKAYHHNIYALVRQTSLAKDFGEKIKTAHDRKSVNQSKNERWQFQVNTKFLTHPDERSKFVTDVKLVNVVTSHYPTTNNQLRNSSNPRQQATINNGRVTLQPIQGRQTSLYFKDLHSRSKWKQFWKTEDGYLLQLQRGRSHVQTVL
ncbi:hypothetical protein Tco_0299656 [Tanacetum coccineum]